MGLDYFLLSNMCNASVSEGNNHRGRTKTKLHIPSPLTPCPNLSYVLPSVGPLHFQAPLTTQVGSSSFRGQALRAPRTIPRGIGSGSPLDDLPSPGGRIRLSMDASDRTRAESSTGPSSSSTALLLGGKTLDDLSRILSADLSHLFDDKGVDPSLYAAAVEFRDPITKYDSVDGCAFT